MLAFGATNGAVDVVVRYLAVELAPIRVNAVSPGTIDTGAYDSLGEEKKAAYLRHHAETNPARRNGEPEDVAEAVLYALTNTFVTGTSLSVDGANPSSERPPYRAGTHVSRDTRVFEVAARRPHHP